MKSSSWDMLKEKCVVNSSNFKLTVCILITVDNKRKKTFFSQKNLLIGMNQNKRYGRTIKITKYFVYFLNTIFRTIQFYFIIWIPMTCTNLASDYIMKIYVWGSVQWVFIFVLFIFMFIRHTSLPHLVPHLYLFHFCFPFCLYSP